MPLIEIAFLIHTAAVAVAGGLSALSLSYSVRISEPAFSLPDYLMLAICICTPMINIAFSCLLIKLLVEYKAKYKY